MSALLSIAPELIHAISDQLDVCDIKPLRLTCTHLGELLISHVLRKLTIDLNKQRIDTDIPKLQALASGFSAAARGVRELTVISVDPGHVDGEWVRYFESEQEPEKPPEVKIAEEALKICLFEAISSLKSITTVRWTPTSKEPVWAQQLVANALITLPNLERLHIATSCAVKIPFDAFPPLRELSLTGLGAQNSYPKIREDLVKLISISPQLSSLNVEGAYCYRQAIDKDQSLHGLVKDYPKGNAPLRLRELSVEMFLVRLDKITLPHLRHLTSLKLRNIPDPYYQEAEDLRRAVNEDVLHSKVYQDQKVYGSSRSVVWLALAEERIWLQEIVTDHASVGLLTYLESYSGLERLKLQPGGFKDGGASDAVASRFFEKSIGNHTKSIQELDLNPSFEGGWCLSKNSLAIISSCTKLKDLRMRIISSQIQENRTNSGKFLPKNIVKLFLDTVAVQLPLLETLWISASNSEGNRGAVCGTAGRLHIGQTNHLIGQAVRNYKAPWACNRLPQLTVGLRNFTPALQTPEAGVKGRVKGFMNQWSRSDEAKDQGRMIYKPHFTDEEDPICWY